MPNDAKEFCFVFLDTNCLIQYKNIDQIDWKALTGYKHVSLLIAPIVLTELNRHKDRGDKSRVRERARTVISLLRELTTSSSPRSVRDGVNIEIITGEPLIDFPLNGLDGSVADDRLIGTALAFVRRNNNAHPVFLATGDFAVEMKAKARTELQPLAMPYTLALPPENDPAQKELRELKAKLTKYENAAPKLRLTGFQREDKGRLFFRKELDSSKRLDRIMDNLQGKYRFITNAPLGDDHNQHHNQHKEAAALSELFNPKPEDIEEYNAKLRSFFDDYRTWYLDHEATLNCKRLSCPLFLNVVNEGNKVAEDVHVKLHLPDGFEVMAGYPELKRGPRPPERPRAAIFATLPQLNLQPRGLLNSLRLPEPTASGQVTLKSLRRTHSYDAEMEFPRLRQRDSIELTVLFIHFSSIADVKSFELEYQITAANSPIYFDGKMPVICSKF
jgi:hypothetical protein